MKYIETFREGAHISEVYLCKTKQIALTKNGKEYGSLTLQGQDGDRRREDLGAEFSGDQ